ncbi:MAG: dihydroxy-acid dehydratase [Firmicutes bacterium]|nr:dihydroxy-acid dehydratase [Bacillota bacterium]
MKRPEGLSDYAFAILKTHLASAGVPYEVMDRPVIGVVNSWNEIVPGHVPLREAAEAVKAGVRRAGGVPLEFNTIAVCDGMAQGHKGMCYPLPSRELITDSIEVMVNAHAIFDGLVFLTACDKITPAMLMAAVRLNLPAVFATSGPMRPLVPASHKKAIRQAFLQGKIGEAELVRGGLEYYPGPGVCPFYGTANTMLAATEALGMMLPGDATALAGSAERTARAQAAGTLAVRLAQSGTKPRSIMNRDAFMNAIRVVLATGGSLNAVLHLPAIAAEAGVHIGLDDFDRLSRDTPLLCGLAPNGPHSAADFHLAGGVPAIMKALGDLVNLDVPTVGGQTWRDILASLPEPSKCPDVVRDRANPLQPEGGVAVLYGNLAPEGAVVKQSAVPAELRVFEGPARVFNSEEECVAALEAGRVQDGSVIVIRYEGPRGGPGMREMHRITELGALLSRVAIVTDGRFSGASAGLSVGYVRPEAWDGGPLALVEDDDVILIDIPGRKLEVKVAADVLARRRKWWERPQKEPATAFLRSYRERK